MSATYPTISAGNYTVSRNGASVTITVPFTGTNGNSQGVTAKYMQIHKYQSSVAIATSGAYAQTVTANIVDSFSDYGGGSKTIYGDLWVQTDSVPNQYYDRASKNVSWSAATFTVTFDDNYTGGSSSTQTETYGSSWTLPTDPVRSGYAFLGWFDDPSAGTQVEAGDTVAITANTTLYAHWSAQSILHVSDGAGAKTITEIYAVDNDGVHTIIGCYAVDGDGVHQGV